MTISGWRPNAPSGARPTASPTRPQGSRGWRMQSASSSARRQTSRARCHGLDARAGAVSAELPEIANAPSGPRELVEWSSRVRAHVFVAAGQLDSQRDRVIREASELGSMLLGEPLYGATPAQVRARVEAAAA